MKVDQIFKINSSEEFKNLALQVFEYQFYKNRIYRSFCDLLNKTPSDIKDLEDIPFLPIRFFKTHKVLCEGEQAQKVFISSGTSGTISSKHYISDLKLYERSFTNGFSAFYGKPHDYTILALLPTYLERGNSSLVFMVDQLIQRSKKRDSGFFLNDFDKLSRVLRCLEERGEKIILIGVSFALLDLLERNQFRLKNTIIMETGGMKGRREEPLREELHQRLKSGFGVKVIHSEYGMTELLSQAYSRGVGIFESPPWMKVLIREVNDPLSYAKEGKTGGLNIIDLANVNSCAFIATEDLGRRDERGRFEVLGRLLESEIRGCSLIAVWYTPKETCS